MRFYLTRRRSNAIGKIEMKPTWSKVYGPRDPAKDVLRIHEIQPPDASVVKALGHKWVMGIDWGGEGDVTTISRNRPSGPPAYPKPKYNEQA